MVLVTKTQKLVENSNLYRSYFKVVLLVVTHYGRENGERLYFTHDRAYKYVCVSKPRAVFGLFACGHFPCACIGV